MIAHILIELSTGRAAAAAVVAYSPDSVASSVPCQVCYELAYVRDASCMRSAYYRPL